MALYGNMIGGAAPLKTVILTDENGNEIMGVVTGSEVIFTATDSQVADGFIYAGDGGVSTGTREFLAYRTERGFQVVKSGQDFIISLPEHDKYNYTQLQCLIAPFSNQYAVEQTVIDNAVYSVLDGEKMSDVAPNATTKTIDLNINNSTENTYMIYYFVYKEEAL